MYAFCDLIRPEAPMRLPRFRLRTLMIAVAGVAVATWGSISLFRWFSALDYVHGDQAVAEVTSLATVVLIMGSRLCMAIRNQPRRPDEDWLDPPRPE